MGRSATLLVAAALVPLGLYAGPAFASRVDASRSAEDCPEKRTQEIEATKALKPTVAKPKKRRYVLM